MKNKAKMMRNMLYGMLGAAIAMISMWLSHSYGKENVKNGFIQSNWVKMPIIRFEIALVLMAIAVPVYYLGAKEMIKGVRVSRRRGHPGDMRMVKLFDMCMHISVIGALFIDGAFISMALIYKLLYGTKLMGADIITVTEGLFYYYAIPVFVYLVVGIGGTSISSIYLIIQDRMRVSKLCIFFNPLVFFLIGEGLKLTKIHYLVDFASAAVPFGFMLLLAVGMVHVAKLPDARRRRNR